MRLFILIGLVVASTLAYGDPKQDEKEKKEKFEKQLFKFGFEGKVKALDFELDAWTKDDALTFEQVKAYDPALADKLWPKKVAKDKKDDSVLEGKDNPKAEEKKEEKKAAMGKEELKKAVDRSVPALTGLENHMLALLVRMRAENIIDKAPDAIKKEINDWRKKELDALMVLRPRMLLKDLGLSKDVWDRLKEKFKNSDPPLDELALGDFRDPRMRDRLESILSDLDLKGTADLMALLDKTVEESHNKNIGPTRYLRYLKRLADIFKLDPPESPDPHQWGGGGPGGGGDDDYDGGSSGPAPTATRPNLCKEDPTFKAILEAERAKKATFTSSTVNDEGKAKNAINRVNQVLTVQHQPGVSGTCGSSVVDTSELFFEPDKGTKAYDDSQEDTIPAKVLTAAHCVLRRTGRGMYAQVPASNMRIQMAGIPNGVKLLSVKVPPPFNDERPGVSHPLGHDIAVLTVSMKLKDFRALKEKQALVKLAESVPGADKPIMIHTNPALLRQNGCKGDDYGEACNRGILAATLTRERISNPPHTYGVSVKNDCNDWKSGKYPNSIQQGTSGSANGYVKDGQFYVVGVQSTKSVFDGSDGLFGSIAGVDSPFVFRQVGFPVPTAVTRANHGDNENFATHSVTPQVY